MKIKKNGKVITLTESDLQRIVKKALREQGSENSSDKTAMEKEIAELELLKKELESAKSNLESKKKIVGGTLKGRIKNYFKIRKIRNQNEKLEEELMGLEEDIKDFEDGKLLTDNQKKTILLSIGSAIAHIALVVKALKGNLVGKVSSAMTNIPNRD
jgi:hypothetical protein